MKHDILKKLAAAGLCVCLCGCSLARPDAGPTADPSAAPAQDELIGGFVTEDYLDLFDIEAYLNDQLAGGFTGGVPNFSSADRESYSDRIYGSVNQDGTVTFPGVEGVGLYLNQWTDAENETCLSIDSDDCFTDRGIESHSTDEGESRVIKATLYADRAILDDRTIGFYLNPVYRTPDGQVYLTAGTGSHVNLTEHDSNGTLSSTVRSKTTVKNTDGTTESREQGVKVSLGAAWAARTVTLVQLDETHQVLKSESWPADALPADTMDTALLLEEAADYVLVERHFTRRDGTPGVEREAYSAGDFLDYEGARKLCVSLMIPGVPYADLTGLWLAMP